jgi:hypothetical protein
MEYLIKDLIVRLSERKVKEIDLVEKYKNENLHDLLLISAGKIIELDYMVTDLEELIKYHSNIKSI